jgi:hypothetical protein
VIVESVRDDGAQQKPAEIVFDNASKPQLPKRFEMFQDILSDQHVRDLFGHVKPLSREILG